MLLAKMNLGIISNDKEEIALYSYHRQINKLQTKKGNWSKQKRAICTESDGVLFCIKSISRPNGFSVVRNPEYCFKRR